MNSTKTIIQLIQENAARAEMRRDRYMALDGPEYATVETYWSGYLDACIDLLALMRKEQGWKIAQEDIGIYD